MEREEQQLEKQGEDTVRVAVNEIQEADVSFISLVDRGATRLPFKVVKREEEKCMKPKFDFKALFVKKPMTKADNDNDSTQGKVLAIYVDSVEQLKAEAAMRLAGYTTNNVDVDVASGVLTYKQEGFNTDMPVQAVALTKGLVMSIQTNKSFSSYPSTVDFLVNLSATGLFPGINIASEAMLDTIREIIYKSETTVDAVASVKIVLADFTAYVEAKVAELPIEVFKMEDCISKVKAGEETTPVPTSNATSDTDDGVAPRADEVQGDVVSLNGVADTAKPSSTNPDATNKTEAQVAELKLMVLDLDTKIEAMATVSAKRDNVIAHLQEQLSGVVLANANSDDQPTRKTEGVVKVNWDSVLDFGG